MSSHPPPGSIPLDSDTGHRIIGVTVAGSAVAALTATVVNVALPALARDLHANSAQQQWIVSAYLLTVASLILTGGSLGDRYGRVRIYRHGTAVFAAASIACAAAPNVAVLIGARLVQGVGGAMLIPGSLAIIEASIRDGDRGRGVGQWSGLSGVAGAIGPLVGGLLVDVSWRWAFLMNLPIAAVVIVLGRSLPETGGKASSDQPIDVMGALLSILMLGGVSFGFIQGANSGYDLTEWVAMAAGLAAAAALIPWERRQPDPMVPLDLFRIRPFVGANVVTLFVYGGMGILFFMLPLQLQVSLGWSPLMAGASMLPVTLLMLALSSKAGALAQRTGPRLPLTVGPLVAAVGMWLISAISPGDTYVSAVLPAVIVFGAGLVLSVAPVTSTALGSVPVERAGAASGVNNAVARTGQFLTVAIVPPLVGLTGSALQNGTRLNARYPTALHVSALLVAVGGLAAFAIFRPRDAEATSPRTDGEPDAGVRVGCAVDGPGLIIDQRPTGHETAGAG